MDSPETVAEWLVYSREHNLWWRANRCGYTNDMELAGRYTEQEAKAIAGECNRRVNTEPWDLGPSEFAVPAPEALRARDEAHAEEVKRINEAINDLLGCGHVLEHRITVLRNYWDDPKMDKAKGFAKIIEKRQEMHRKLVALRPAALTPKEAP